MMDVRNTPPRIHRVRRVGAEWHVTYADSRPSVAVPVVNAGSYRSRVSYGFTADGALVAREVQP